MSLEFHFYLLTKAGALIKGKYFCLSVFNFFPHVFVGFGFGLFGFLL